MLVLSAMGLIAGCQSMPMGLGKNREAHKRPAFSEGDGPTGIAGPVERQLKAQRWNREKYKDPSLAPALAEYDAAELLYKQGKYEDAEKAFKTLASSRRHTYESFSNRWERWWGMRGKKDLDPYEHYGDPVEEDSMFMLAECQFQQKKYSWAQDSYDGLLERFPSTRHMEKSTHRLFRIGMYWLGFADHVIDDGDVKLTKAETIDPAHPPKAPQIPKIPVIPNFTDRSKPVFDTSGRALQALRSIWLHDAAGPLADDALIMSASYHLKTGDFVEAKRLYKLMREQYPDSPHFQDAHLLGAYVTMASYEGAAYDESPLKEARNLKLSALQMFPNLSEEERKRLEKDVERMNNAEVARLWDQVDYYRVKRQPQSIEIYCNVIINEFPDSPYAEKARKMLKSIRRPQSSRSKKKLPPEAEAAKESVNAEQNENSEELSDDPEQPGRFEPAELTGRIDVDDTETPPAMNDSPAGAFFP